MSPEIIVVSVVSVLGNPSLRGNLVASIAEYFAKVTSREVPATTIFTEIRRLVRSTKAIGYKPDIIANAT